MSTSHPWKSSSEFQPSTGVKLLRCVVLKYFLLLSLNTVLVTHKYTHFLANTEGASRLSLRVPSGMDQGWAATSHLLLPRLVTFPVFSSSDISGRFEGGLGCRQWDSMAGCGWMHGALRSLIGNTPTTNFISKQKQNKVINEVDLYLRLFIQTRTYTDFFMSFKLQKLSLHLNCEWIWTAFRHSSCRIWSFWEHFLPGVICFWVLNIWCISVWHKGLLTSNLSLWRGFGRGRFR